MDKRFLRAFLTPSRTVIEGYSLYPWCIKHRLWLEGIDSPFMRSDAPIEVGDLLLVLRICSETEIDRPSLRERFLGIRLALDKARFEAACRAFVQHTDTTAGWPKFFEKKDESSGGGPNTPWPLAIVCNLIKNGMTYESAMQMPEAKAIWLSTAFAISAGAKLELLTTEDEELIDSLQRERDQQKNEPTA